MAKISQKWPKMALSGLWSPERLEQVGTNVGTGSPSGLMTMTPFWHTKGQLWYPEGPKMVPLSAMLVYFGPFSATFGPSGQSCTNVQADKQCLQDICGAAGHLRAKNPDFECLHQSLNLSLGTSFPFAYKEDEPWLSPLDCLTKVSS